MAYQATVCNVMIACPSDVEEERQTAREVIWNWNYLHSQRTNIVLMPVAWETHSAPDVGDRPQAIINKQVLEGIDLLIGIFWTRLGTPTGREDSGTVEEIKEHVKKGKPAMLYFSAGDIPRDSIDTEQLRRLNAFKEECETTGLIARYRDVSDFKDQLTHHLMRTVDNHEYFKKVVSESTNWAIHGATKHAGAQQGLSAEGRILLLEAVQDPHGSVLKVMTRGGLTIGTNGKNMVTAPQDPRSQALWEGALEEILTKGLVADVSYKGEGFRVTREGYALADLLKADG
jgi:hypothetical protein